MKKYLSLCILIFPWRIRRFIYRKVFGYEVHNTARIGLSWVFPDKLVMEAGCKIGHLNVCKNINQLFMAKHSKIGSLNWITGFPLFKNYKGHFSEEVGRVPSLNLGEHSAITSRHIIDCTNTINIGKYTTVAGLRSQILTHGIDISLSIQTSQPITIGNYCFIGSGCVLLKGAIIPSYSVVGALALVNKIHKQEYTLYAGVPAKPVSSLSCDNKYFSRKSGRV